MKKKSNASWSRLDNAAKIFPPTSNKRDTKVFRFACELYQPVDASILQTALDKTMDDFPVYHCILKKGLFWYYLETSNIVPQVELETLSPCSPLYIHNKKTLLFRVTYFNNRISLEVYHAISDGTGAMHFLRTLVSNYITTKFPERFANQSVLFEHDASIKQKMDDSFKRYYSSEKSATKVLPDEKAHQVKCSRIFGKRIGIIEAIVPLDQVLKAAHDHNTTLTVLLASLFLCSINKEMAVRDRKFPVNMVVPVNLRKYFHSESIRNFFGVINVGYHFKSEDEKLEDVIESLSKSFSQELTIERLTSRMNSLSALENNVFARPIPLFLKDIIMRIANKISEKHRTASISNIGRVDMPQELQEYIRLFDVFVSTKIIQISMCSFKNNLVISFSSAYSATEIQKDFFRALTAWGIPVEITTNHLFDRGLSNDEIL